ncbi:hypothetical protein V3851_15450 [Paenibacillus sp. M1]|uniref:VCBS repeat-containing protein n=1 Tax=Paenibacillus haidiansis TaxID=1574488 RepID=A0ABU7VWE9_9BACL
MKLFHKNWITAAVGGFLLMTLSGCNIIKDPKSLMETPQLTSDKESLISVINAEIKGAQIIRPRDVSDISPIRTPDLDNDGVNEAIVFYETPDEAVRIHGMILERTEDTWTVQVRFDGEGQVLETFDLRDITGDGNLDIITGFSNGEEDPQKGLTVYSYNGTEVESLLSLPYNDFLIDDLNQDDRLDLTVVNLKRDQNAVVTTYQYGGETFQELSHIQLDDPIKEYYNVVSGSITPELKGIILDASFGTHYAYSHMVVMKEGKLIDLLPSQDSTFKNYPVLSGDTDGDGILEVGRSEKPKGWEDRSYDDIPLFSYYQWDEDQGLKFVMQQYMDLAGRFYFNFPKDWWGNVTIDPKSDQNEHIWFTTIDSGKTVAEIAFFSLTEWERHKGDWELLARDYDKVIGFLSHTDLEINKGEKEIKR